MKFLAVIIISLLTVNSLQSQYAQRMTRPVYFETYKDMAILEMQRSGVPASITLAQGALESGDGNSRLAREANNHFGIKCHNDWNGKKIFEDDDSKNECFRKYKSVEESYRDHSDYLRSKSRYATLFELNISDYKGWARGLKKAGYATSPTYAESLIRIIEEFDLNKYDIPGEAPAKKHNREEKKNHTDPSRPVLERNRVKYIIAVTGDTYESVTQELGKLTWEIPQYNDIMNPDTLVAGQILFIQPKRNKAEAGKNEHVVKEGETMYMISQFYAIKLDKLYAMNPVINRGTIPPVGTVLQLRKLKRSLPEVKPEPLKENEEGEEIRIDLNLE